MSVLDFVLLVVGGFAVAGLLVLAGVVVRALLP